METTSFFPGLIALLLAAILGFLAAWIWRSKQLAAADKQAARLRRERREITAKMTQASRKFNALSQQRTKAVDALSTLKQQHQALETGHAQLIASYANLKQSARRAEAGDASNPPDQDSDEEWFEGMDAAEGSQQTPTANPNQDSPQKREALKELEAFEQRLSTVSEQLARENNPPAVADPSPDAAVPASSSDTEALRAQIARQEAEIERLRDQMAPLLGLPLAVSTREAERDRLADVLQAKEQEIASKDEALMRQEKELAAKQQEILAATRELERKTQMIAENQTAFDNKLRDLQTRQQKDFESNAGELEARQQQVSNQEQKIAELNAALRQRAEREATLNRELAELNAAAKRTEDTHREALRRISAASTENPPNESESGGNAGKLGNLGREVKDSSSTKAGPQSPERTKSGTGTSDATKKDTTTVQAAPSGSTVAVKDIPARRSRPVNGSRADVAAVELDRPRKKQSIPRQFDRAPARVDNLKEIKGIGPVLERMLNRLGVYQFCQIAAWSEEDIAYFDDQLADFRGRIRRDDWPAGAAIAHDRKYA